MPEDPHEALTPQTLAVYMSSGRAVQIRIGTDPVCILGIDPVHDELTLRTPATDEDFDLSGYRMIRGKIIEEIGEGAMWFRLAIDATGHEYEAYSLLRSVSEHLQQGERLERALVVSLDGYRDLFSRIPRLSADQETGLFGELLALADEIGAEASVKAWLGPRGEEHDFVLPDVDVEVKTTTSEKRTHIIHGVDQLTRTPGRPLQMLSIQLTRAGASNRGLTLTELVGAVRRGLRLMRTELDERLELMGWRDPDAEELFTSRFLQRTAPRFYDVDDSFPAITSDGLSRILERPELVRGVDYRIDVSAIEGTDAPAWSMTMRDEQEER
ncbi:PD-(D/E)XK motif protein [Schaalia cardiffensis]|uniref:PD-(D/E)XK motif protein n=1 Tax=Schaalia cardiffensis TaxID=181487 RepID=UPI0018E8E553|nr:PD-(D/E)XK motif protein [Schaalia cardiffensis]